MADAKIGPKRDYANRFMSDKTAVEILGKKKGMLTFLSETILINKQGDKRRAVVCKCDCGKVVTRQLHPLKWTKVPSCGCKRKLPNGRAKHGDSSNGKVTGEYRSWHGAKSRCYKTDHHNYPDYGGRGITMCPTWISSYETFLKDMGRRPDKKMSLDRIDVNKGYYPDNCRWADAQTQAENRRNTVWITVGPRTMTASEFTKLSMMSPFLVNKMAKSGMSGDEIAKTAIEALARLMKID